MSNSRPRCPQVVLTQIYNEAKVLKTERFLKTKKERHKEEFTTYLKKYYAMSLSELESLLKKEAPENML
jgi:hypothetical protein